LLKEFASLRNDVAENTTALREAERESQLGQGMGRICVY
jgi:hypothetical protein